MRGDEIGNVMARAIADKAIEIHEKLAALLRVSEEAAAVDCESVSVVVAGAGF